ncbi:hypothetical protein NEOC95_002291 [Neochlamydia sp. AcF95]|nr:hypothetical protein [Neochlamydia sp. AcF95]
MSLPFNLKKPLVKFVITSSFLLSPLFMNFRKERKIWLYYML